MLLAVLAANISRTPVSGRPRLFLLDRQLKESIVSHFYASSGLENAPAYVQWYHILRQLFGEDGAPAGTLLGEKMIEPMHDWRQGWCEGVVQALEGNLDALNESRTIGEFTIPATPWPLHSSAGKSHYTVLLVDRPDINAFSFGWPPGTKVPAGSSAGCIVVFTGLLDSIMQQDGTQISSSIPASSSDPSVLSKFLKALSASPTPKPSVDPTIMPSPEQTRQLAVLLSHELSHLLLGHVCTRNMLCLQS